MKTKTLVKHTPGPWKACLNVPTAVIPGHIIKADHGAETPVALLWEGGGTRGKPTQLANARLIAAAPELLAALEAFVSGWPGDGACISIHATAFKNARAAIAKARNV